MTPAARLQAAIEMLDAVSNNAARPADTVAREYLKTRRYIGSADRRALSERVWGILRRRARLDWWLARQGAEPTARARVLADLALTDGATPEQANRLLDGRPHHPYPLSPDERGLIGALSGRSLFHHDMPESVRGEYPDWLEPLLREAFGDTMPAEVAALRDEAAVDLRANSLKCDREQAIAALAAEGITAQPTALSPLGLRLSGRVALGIEPPFRDGLVEVQDEGSQIVAMLVGARPGHAVADYCAGAGGKTLAIAAAMENKGRLVALDIHTRRAERARDRLRRAGVHNVIHHILGEPGDKWPKRHAASFDRVLADAPCSGSGTWRRNPDARWHLTPQDLDELNALQADILERSARLVKPGGRLIYATCSVFRREDEDQVERFLAAHPDFRVLSVADLWAETVGTPCPVEGPMLRLTPARHHPDGFFAAVMERAPAA
ncbi:MAG: RsmB/NOP family class I SAM-dependent RNA methyltransferase [Alphaproteobacteria bacterium]|nr:RsmB/NOP family class I SAM-dependent RNA methyltransferase [Alphaproteobacteria bacterium]